MLCVILCVEAPLARAADVVVAVVDDDASVAVTCDEDDTAEICDRFMAELLLLASPPSELPKFCNSDMLASTYSCDGSP